MASIISEGGSNPDSLSSEPPEPERGAGSGRFHLLGKTHFRSSALHLGIVHLGGVGHSASEGGCFRQVSIVSKMLIFSLDDYFKLFYTCFQHGNLFISIYEQTQDISIFQWPETAKNETLFWLVGAGKDQ